MNMERFFEPTKRNPIGHIELREGETKVVGLKKFNAHDVAVRSQDFKVAFCDKAIHLNKNKLAYDKHNDLNEVAGDTAPVEVNGAIFFQLCGSGKGTTQVTARLTSTSTIVSYAEPLEVTVTENKKRLVLPPSPSFDTL
jgi:hypothetical protein